MQSILRTSLSLPVAAVITASLAFFMAYLISVEGEPGPDIAELTFDLFPRVDPIDPVQPPVLTPVDPVAPPPPPPTIDVQTSQLPTDDFVMMAGTIPGVEVTRLGGDLTSFNISDGDVQPLVRIPPVYPARESERGIEGDCVLQFDVTVQGSPVNIQVLECASPGFARESIRAVERWRYNPRIRDGVPQMYHGVQTRLEFNLND